MKPSLSSLASVAIAVMLLAGNGVTAMAQVPAGPKIAVQAITQVAPNLPQYTKVDQPLLRDGIARPPTAASKSRCPPGPNAM